MPRETNWKLKHMTNAMRESIEPMPVPGILEFKRSDFTCKDVWFRNEGNRTGRVYSVRNMDEKVFVFRLK